MDENNMKESVSCPIRTFPSSEFPSSNLNIFNSENQSSKKNDESNIIEKNGIGEKEQNMPSDAPANKDLLNGHSNSDGVDVPHRNNSVGELLDDTPHLPGSELLDSSKGGIENNMEVGNNDLMSSGPGQNSLSSMTQKKTEEIKNFDDGLSQDIFGGSQEKEESKQSSNQDSSEKNESSNGDFSEGFDLHLSETQSFLPPSEKEKPGATLASESEDSNSNAMEEESNDKVSDGNEEKESDDVEMSNESSSNAISNSDASALKENTNDDVSNKEDETKDSDEVDPVPSGDEDKKTEEMEVCETDGPETNGEGKEASKDSVENKETGLQENKDEEKQSDELKEESSDSSPEPKENMELDEEKSKSDDINLEEKSNEEQSKDENKGEETEKEGVTNEEVKEDEEKGTESEVKATVRTSGRARKLSKKLAEATKKDVGEPEEKKVEPLETENDQSETSIDDTAPCTCEPGCHQRIHKISQHLNSACSQLDSFIKQKRRDENKLLKSFLDMLKEIHSISQNKNVSGESKISDHILIPEETPPKRKSGIKRKSNDIDTPLKESPRKRMNTEEKSTKKTDKKSNVDFKDLKGLAVFAKWPNSGWYYPGKVEELTGNDWKDATNVTVKFYDGLVREMKNINILPAYLIPPGSMLCDLDDETEMIVLSCDGSNQNSVDFKLSTKDSSNSEVELNFNKLAIRAINMKTIKQQLEPTTDVVPKKMHMVSLDNLVSGRRSRGRSKKDADDADEKTTSNQTERRSGGSSTSSTPSKRSTPRRTRN